MRDSVVDRQIDCVEGDEMVKRTRRSMVIVSIVVLLSCCGGDDDDADSVTSPTVDTGTTTATTTPSTSAVTTAGPAPASTVQPPVTEPEEVQWPLGPGAADRIPKQYAALQPGADDEFDCETIARLVSEGELTGFWPTLAQLCLTIRDGAPWPDDSSPLAPPPAENDFQNCLNNELATMLQAAMAWHRQHPGAAPYVDYPPYGSLSPCDQRLYGYSTEEYTDNDHPGGGLKIELNVPGLPDSRKKPPVLVDGVAVEYLDNFSDENTGVGNGAVFLPAPVTAHEATLVVERDIGTLQVTIDVPDVSVTSTTTSSGGSSSSTTSTSQAPKSSTTTSGPAKSTTTTTRP